MSPWRLLQTLCAVLVLALPRGASAAEGPGGDDAHLLRDCGPAVRKADLIVEAIAGAVRLPSSDLEIAVTSVLKGEANGECLTVRMAKAAMGRWPRESEAGILCLVALPEGRTEELAPEEGETAGPQYELATHHASVLPATDEAREAVRGWLQGKAPPRPPSAVAQAGAQAGPEASSADSPQPRGARPGANPYLRPAAASDAVLVGALTGVGPERGSGPDIVGSFAVEGALFGYGAFKAPVAVRFPARSGEATQPGSGRYLLFLVGSRSGDGFVVVERVRLSGAAREVEAKRLVLEALGPRKARLTTIQATLAEWQDAWNARDVARCIQCYGRASRLRRRYASGGNARRDLERQIRGSPGTVSVSIEKIRIVLAPTSEGARETAEVEVLIELTPRTGATAREHATMQFVHETGEWLILREGF
ncbi:MAG: Cif family virulence factor [Planctomycetota bacterium]|jgi:hypothetical protein